MVSSSFLRGYYTYSHVWPETAGEYSIALLTDSELLSLTKNVQASVKPFAAANTSAALKNDFYANSIGS